jgi:hypothetical protein
VSIGACDSWQFDLAGGGVITTPTGDEITTGARLVWTFMADRTVRFLIYASGDDRPIVRVISPAEPSAFARMTVAAFEELTGAVTQGA